MTAADRLDRYELARGARIRGFAMSAADHELAIRRCQQCSSHFRGFDWQRLCRVCYAWTVAARRIFAAQCALRTVR